MKTSMKTLLCAVALSTSAAFAGPGSEIKKPTTFSAGIYATVGGNLNVNVVKKASVFTSVTILNAYGDILARESLTRKQTNNAIRFDLSALEDGEYIVEIASKGEKEVKKFTISSEKLVTKRALSFE